MRNASVSMGLLEEFVYLADCLSFKKAADHFYVSRSVISRHMAALEEALGTRLFERDSRTVGLTGAGRVFYHEARIVLRDWETALDRVREARRDSTAVVRIGYLRNAARPVLVPFMRYMAANHPEVGVSLVCLGYDELRQAMEEHSVDVAVAMNVNPAISRNYRSTRIYEDEFYVVCAAGHPIAECGQLVLEDLKGRRVLLPDSLRDLGLAELPETLVDADSFELARLFYSDIDIMNLKIQTEGCVALTSGLNGELFGDGVVMLPLADVNTSFSVSAFYQDDFAGDVYLACCDAFGRCRDGLVRED